MGLGQYREAANDFTAAIDLVGQDPDMILQRGLAHAALGERLVALADFEEVLRLNPTSAAARANRDILLAQGGTSR
jgi:regulator of sirC expression with transglutaminase-like and TPR domain